MSMGEDRVALQRSLVRSTPRRPAEVAIGTAAGARCGLLRLRQGKSAFGPFASDQAGGLDQCLAAGCP